MKKILILICFLCLFLFSNVLAIEIINTKINFGLGVLVKNDGTNYVVEIGIPVEELNFFIGFGNVVERRNYYGETEIVIYPSYFGTEIFPLLAEENILKIGFGLLFVDRVEPFGTVFFQGDKFFFQIRGGESMIIIGGIIF